MCHVGLLAEVIDIRMEICQAGLPATQIVFEGDVEIY